MAFQAQEWASVAKRRWVWTRAAAAPQQWMNECMNVCMYEWMTSVKKRKARRLYTWMSYGVRRVEDWRYINQQIVSVLTAVLCVHIHRRCTSMGLKKFELASLIACWWFFQPDTFERRHIGSTLRLQCVISVHFDSEWRDECIASFEASSASFGLYCAPCQSRSTAELRRMIKAADSPSSRHRSL